MAAPEELKKSTRCPFRKPAASFLYLKFAEHMVLTFRIEYKGDADAKRTTDSNFERDTRGARDPRSMDATPEDGPGLVSACANYSGFRRGKNKNPWGRWFGSHQANGWKVARSVLEQKAGRVVG